MKDCSDEVELTCITGANSVDEVKPLKVGKTFADECFDAVQGTVVPLAVAEPREYCRRVYELYRSSSAVIFGNVLEWYDWTVYAYMEDLLQEIFFEGSEFGAWLVFAVSFLARPLGSLVFGWGADVFGRAVALKVAIWGMALATFAQGCLFPWGPSAVVVIVFLRIVSGFSAGGESAGVNVYMSESGTSDRDQTLVAAVGINNVSGSLAFFLATISSLAVHQMPRVHQVSWGWRLPFLMAAPLGIVSIILRRSLQETKVFEEAMFIPDDSQSKSKHDDLASINRATCGPSIRSIILVIGVLSASISCNYFPVYVVKWLHSHAGFSTSSALLIASVSKFVQLLMSFPVSLLGDRYGATQTMLIGGLASAPSVVLVLVFVLRVASAKAQSAAVLLISAVLALGIWLPIVTSIFMVPAMLYVTSLFPVEQRGRGAGISYGLASCVGGALPAIATSLAEQGSALPGFYLFSLCVPSLLLLAWSRRAHKRGQLKVYQRDWLF